jgi:uncharacterized protein (TIGR02996 family)
MQWLAEGTKGDTTMIPLEVIPILIQIGKSAANIVHCKDRWKKPMNEKHAFLQSIQDKPDDGQLRLVFADWLEERGDPSGELLRLTHILTQTISIPNRSELEARLRTLLQGGAQPIGPFWTNSLGITFAWIPAGTFLMGSPPEEAVREDDEIQHQVTLTKGYFLSQP